MNARIYTILSFELHNGQRFCFSHHVAATSSVEAERIATEHAIDLLRNADELYVITDARDPDPAAAVQTYVSGFFDAPVPHKPIPNDQHARWVKTMTRAYWCDGERVPPLFRRFYVAPAALAA